jgi:hypothetical protein
MKTTNNVQKAILKSLAVVVSFVLISFTVSAQGFWTSILENTSFSEIALAMVETNSETNHSTTADANFADLLETEAEEALELEDWMVNEANFTSVFSIEEETENPLEMEDWMSNENYFTGTTLSLEIETEEALELENWMLEDRNFEPETLENKTIGEKRIIVGRDFIFVHIADEELGLESWMTNNKVWRN